MILQSIPVIGPILWRWSRGTSPEAKSLRSGTDEQRLFDEEIPRHCKSDKSIVSLMNLLEIGLRLLDEDFGSILLNNEIFGLWIRNLHLAVRLSPSG